MFLEGEAPVTPLDRLLERIEGSGGFSRWYFGQLHRDPADPAPVSGALPNGGAAGGLTRAKKGPEPLAERLRTLFFCLRKGDQITYFFRSAGRAAGSQEMVKVMAKPSRPATGSSLAIILASSSRSLPAIFRVWSTKMSVVS